MKHRMWLLQGKSDGRTGPVFDGGFQRLAAHHHHHQPFDITQCHRCCLNLTSSITTKGGKPKYIKKPFVSPPWRRCHASPKTIPRRPARVERTMSPLPRARCPKRSRTNLDSTRPPTHRCKTTNTNTNITPNSSSTGEPYYINTPSRI